LDVLWRAGVVVDDIEFTAVRKCSPASGDAPSEATFILIRAGLLVRESFLLATGLIEHR
jgi:hypothetical protein